MKKALSMAALLAATPVLAEEKRQLDAHEHGVGTLNIAIDGSTLTMEFNAPGSDIVGFEHVAKSDTDRAAMETAITTLATPLELFVLPAAAECTVLQAKAELELEDDHDNHESHSDHSEDDDHAEHDEGAGHSEFHAEYTISCDNTDALTEIVFEYFGAFENAREIEVQIVTGAGAQAYEVERAAPTLDLRSLF